MQHDASQMNENHQDGNNNDGTFICGVVEGFYGKPWSFEQRKDLFKKLGELKLSSFMYAPKDDVKHRNKWRELYSDREAKELKTLIDEARANGIDFYYSLAPGLDMIYSDRTEVELMIRKYDQLVELGCRSFAILFDDIEPSIINEKDREAFKNYASAQVYVTNLIFDHLKHPKFLFCPTEYCQSRAVPNVQDSIYLNTIGKGLRAGIDIMWSGSRVISRLITEESIEELSKVIRRSPVIWENLHANDYDKKRVFLGPYSGRSTKIIPKLRGVLTNPNCEYEANHIAIHTLAQWSRCSQDASPHNCCNRALKIPIEPDDGCLVVDDNPEPSKVVELDDPTVYDPHKALMLALKDWLPRLLESRVPLTNSNPLQPRDDEPASNQLAKETEESANGGETPMVFVEDEKPSATNNNHSNNNDDGLSKSEMETSGSPASAMQTDGQGQTLPIESNSSDSCDMQVISEPLAQIVEESAAVDCLECAFCSTTPPNRHGCPTSIDLGQLCLLVDLFYLPFEHGPHGQTLLRDIKWLRDNSDALIGQPPSSLPAEGQDNNGSLTSKQTERDTPQEILSPHHNANNHPSPAAHETNLETERGKEKTEDSNKAGESIDDTSIEGSNRTNNQSIWSMRVDRLKDMCNCMCELVDTMEFDCPNRLLVFELYPYLLELRNLASMVLDYIKYLPPQSNNSTSLTGSCQSNEMPVIQQPPGNFLDDQEPWVFRGGLIGDVQRLLATQSAFRTNRSCEYG